MTTIEFLIRETEGQISFTSNEEAYKALQFEEENYQNYESQLKNKAYANIDDDDLFGALNIDTTEDMKKAGYHYSYKNGNSVMETPSVIIEKTFISEDVSFLGSDGVSLSNKKVVLKFK